MSKISKLLIMTVVMLAVITLSVCVNAGQTSLIDYVTKVHIINGMAFELPNKDKEAVRAYLSKVSDAQADVALGKIKEAESMLVNSKVKKLESLSQADKAKAISLAKEAANAVGLELKVDTAQNTYQLISGGKVIAGGPVSNAVQYSTGGGAAGGSGAPSSTTPVAGTSYLYTGASYVGFAAIVLAIVAVAVVVKKRA